ncbi:MAG: ABC transporter permease subunit [Thermodesulfobacteriota bacterium]
MDEKLLRRVKNRDRTARWVITGGGLTVIASVLAILILIVKVTLPLFMPTEKDTIARFPIPAGMDPVLAAGIDEYLEHTFLIDSQGNISVTPVAGGETTLLRTGATGTITHLATEGRNRFTALYADGTVDVFAVTFTPAYADGSRTLIPGIDTLLHLNLPAAGSAVAGSSRITDDGSVVVVLTAANQLLVRKQTVTTDLFGEETKEDLSFAAPLPVEEKLTCFTLDNSGSRLYAGTDGGTIVRWDIGGGEARLLDTTPAHRGSTGISSLAMVFGSVSLAVGASNGEISTWMEVAGEDGHRRLRRIHSLTPHRSPVVNLIPSRRDKSLVSIGADGAIHWDHMTSENNLLSLAGDGGKRLAALADRNNGMVIIDAGGQVTALALSCPHPEISLRTLFGKVWYESYPEPEMAWQSSSGSDDFEPKFSITPLLFGTVKGTFYAMLFAVPLAIFGAVYVSQFARGRFKRLVKPVVEIMASIPSVVIGFLAALWLAPLVESYLLSLFAAGILIPLCFLLFMVIWQQATDRSHRIRHMRKGWEFLIVAPVILLAVMAAGAIGPYLERSFFGNDFRQWLFSHAAITYDQRNCIIIAFGLGFTVIPIIFSIAEDSLSNVPPSLSAASLALGASRWQTVWRVILPSASPGIFAGIMIGFGRAVGETMIVLMATGNTPIMDWSAFNGMRTLSANIAVEIPEAPVDSTLYRVLFLCAVLLFVLTFLLNTGAEVIRERLRRKYMRY